MRIAKRIVKIFIVASCHEMNKNEKDVPLSDTSPQSHRKYSMIKTYIQSIWSDFVSWLKPHQKHQERQSRNQ